MTLVRTIGLTLALSALAGATSTEPLGTAFTYQGQLTESGLPASGLYDFQACLFDDPGGPSALACVLDLHDVPVQAGLFTITLDFGASAFVGQQRYLELLIRPGASTGAYTILAPRQLVRATPEALRANAASAAPWSGLTGVPAGFADGLDNDSGGTVTSIAAGTGLSGGTITGSGTIGIANGGVGSVQIASGAVASTQIADASVAAVDIASNAIEAAELADNAVDSAALQNLAVTQAKIASGAVGSAQLASGAVGLAQIDSAQVQARIAGTCALGEYFRGINADGSVACEPVPGVPRVTTVDDPANSVGSSTALAIGNDARPVICYFDATAGALKVAKCANAACTGSATITTVDDPANIVAQACSLAIGSDGNPVIAYYDVTAFALKVAKCTNPACTGSALITTVDDPENRVGMEPSIAIGSDGLPLIAYQDGTAFTLKVAKCVDAACASAATISIVDDPANAVGFGPSLAIGSDGLPVIAHYDVMANALRVAQCTQTDCTGGATATVVDDPANSVGLHSAIAIGSDGLPAISYWDQTAAALKVAKCANAACGGSATITTVDDPVSSSVGQFTSIAIGTDGMPLISYRDATAGSLKVVHCITAACNGGHTIATVDDPANDVGISSSLAVGADGLPVIGYHDTTADSVKVIKCGTRSCQ